MHIAIVEDDKMDMTRLRQILEKKLKKTAPGSTIDCFNSGEQFLRKFTAGLYELIFFDNYIGHALGIDLARKARSLDPEANFVFVSMSAEFAVAGFEVRALHYLIKPVTPEEIDKVFLRLQEKKEAPAAKAVPEMVELMVEHNVETYTVDSILYIEVNNKACVVHGIDYEVKVYTPMEQLMERLPQERFLRTHRSFVVNIRAITSMTKTDFVMKDGSTVPIGRSFQGQCKRDYIKYLASQ